MKAQRIILKLLTYCCIFLLFIGTNNTCFSQSKFKLASNINADDYAPKTIIFKVKPQYRAICQVNKIDDIEFIKLTSSLQTTSIYKKFPNDLPPAQEYNSYGKKLIDLSLIYELKYNSAIHIEKAINKLLLSGILVYAEPHYIPKLTYTPNDPLATVGSQYHLQRINAYNAWSVNKGDSSIVIGITDTGTDYTHSDLFSNIKRNYNDVIDGADNDGDGFIDNYWGWDVAMNDNDATYQANAHGVHVQGISSASADNANGGAGVGFYCKTLPIKIGDANAQLIAAYEGIKYGADHGCHVINCSWGGGGASQYGQDIIDYATYNKNCLVIASSGNFNTDGDFYPAAFNNVLCVANTASNDTRHSTSNYGYMVDVCAPGDNINSTWPGNAHITLTGTSMSAPVVAGAAGIVKNQFPAYNGLQVGERLKVTADNIYPVNFGFANKLGSGRINLYRALTDPPTPSVVYSNLNISDHNDETLQSGDTLFITSNFLNYLDPTVAFTATITSLSAFATPINNTISIGVINTLASATNSLNPFTFKLTGAIPINQAITFEVLMKDGVYQAKQFFTLNINVDYINITVNDVRTTATSKGKIGYNLDAQSQGLGFNYKGTELLYEGGLMIGIDSTKVSDCVRGSNVSISDIDFGTVNRIQQLVPAWVSDFDTKAKLNDNLALYPLNIEVEQNTFAWATNPNKQFVIWEYKIKNTHADDTLKNLFVGVFADWDIDGGTYGQNRSDYNAATKMGYSYYTGANGKYGGIKLLTQTAPANFYAMDNVAGGNGGIDISNGFDVKEKYRSLSTQRLTAGVAGNGSDVINVMSSGPFQILPNQTVIVAFALLGADNFTELINGANQAYIKYFGVPTLNENSIKTEAISVFPNPTKNSIAISQNELNFTKYEIYDINGKLVSENKIQSIVQKVDLSGYTEGMYVVKLIGKEKVEFKKIVVVE